MNFFFAIVIVIAIAIVVFVYVSYRKLNSYCYCKRLYLTNKNIELIQNSFNETKKMLCKQSYKCFFSEFLLECHVYNSIKNFSFFWVYF